MDGHQTGPAQDDLSFGHTQEDIPYEIYQHLNSLPLGFFLLSLSFCCTFFSFLYLYVSTRLVHIGPPPFSTEQHNSWLRDQIPWDKIPTNKFLNKNANGPMIFNVIKTCM